MREDRSFHRRRGRGDYSTSICFTETYSNDSIMVGHVELVHFKESSQIFQEYVVLPLWSQGFSEEVRFACSSNIWRFALSTCPIYKVFLEPSFGIYFGPHDFLTYFYSLDFIRNVNQLFEFFLMI